MRTRSLPGLASSKDSGKQRRISQKMLRIPIFRGSESYSNHNGLPEESQNRSVTFDNLLNIREIPIFKVVPTLGNPLTTLITDGYRSFLLLT